MIANRVTSESCHDSSQSVSPARSASSSTGAAGHCFNFQASFGVAAKSPRGRAWPLRTLCHGVSGERCSKRRRKIGQRLLTPYRKRQCYNARTAKSFYQANMGKEQFRRSEKKTLNEWHAKTHTETDPNIRKPDRNRDGIREKIKSQNHTITHIDTYVRRKCIRRHPGDSLIS